MDIIGIGTEIVECLRVGRMIEQHGEQFLGRVYTEREIRFCQGRRRSTEHFAAHWAAKEAVLKALHTPWRRGMEWTDIEIQQELGFSPEVLFHGATAELTGSLRLGRVMLSMSHCRAYAMASAIAVKG